MLNYTYFSSPIQIHVPHPYPTFLSSGLSLAYASPWYKFHKYDNMPPVPRWSPTLSICNPVWGVIILLLVTPPQGDILTPRPPHVFPSSPWSVWLPDWETPPGPSPSPSSPLNFHCHTLALTMTMPYTSYHGPVLLLPSLPKLLKSPPTIYALSSSSETITENLYCYKRFYSQGRGSPPTL